MLNIAIDIGGTFTDVVAELPDGFFSVKVLTQPLLPEQSALKGVDLVLKKLVATHSDITGIVHGTTLATNALIERRGAKTAFVTTAGFRDVLEMRYEKRFDQYALDIKLPEPLVPRPLRLTLPERVLSDGSILQAPADADIVDIADVLREHQVEAVAIGFLHAYKNPVHETLVADRLRQLLEADVTICQSAETGGEIREYDRFSTVCANAYVRPLMTQYLQQLKSRLQSKGFDGSFLMMLSDGALTTLDEAIRFPVRLVEGGPAGGVALGAHVAREIGSKNTLSLDIGGTTAKICFIENGVPRKTRRFEIARTWRGAKGSGLPVRVPTVELVEIGAGGGSIAKIDALGRLCVGPQSAGAEPGPAAYGRGGEDATITDAHLAVGNIEATGFADGIIDIDTELARAAVSKHIQQPLDFETAETAAAGMIELADETMANAARVHGIELGLDISCFDLLVSGGGGGLHAARIAEKLGIDRILVPTNAGVGSAVGFLRSPVAFEIAISVEEAMSEIDTGALSQRVSSSLDQVRRVVSEAVPEERIHTSVNAELRYRGQGLELSFSLPHIDDLAKDLLQLETGFREQYKALHGFTLDDIPVELVSLSINAREQRESIASVVAPVNTHHKHKDNRDIYDLNAAKKLSYLVKHRDELDDRIINGPVVVPEAQTTTLVRPGWSIHKSTFGHLIMERAKK